MLVNSMSSSSAIIWVNACTCEELRGRHCALLNAIWSIFVNMFGDIYLGRTFGFFKRVG